ncbi:MAG: hypothetical protein ACETWM_00490 [Candidatus Lokiarchaeia archaeon]
MPVRLRVVVVESSESGNPPSSLWQEYTVYGYNTFSTTLSPSLTRGAYASSCSPLPYLTRRGLGNCSGCSDPQCPPALRLSWNYSLPAVMRPLRYCLNHLS